MLAICAGEPHGLAIRRLQRIVVRILIVMAERGGQRAQRVHAVRRRQHLHQPEDRLRQRSRRGQLRLQIAELRAIRQAPCHSRKQVSSNVALRASSWMSWPQYASTPRSPSRKQMRDEVATTSSSPPLGFSFAVPYQMNLIAYRRAPARGPDAVRSGGSEFRRESPRACTGQGNQQRGDEQVTYRQHQRSRSSDRGAERSICPGVTSDRRSEWRSAKQRAGAMDSRGGVSQRSLSARRSNLTRRHGPLEPLSRSPLASVRFVCH